MVLRQDSVTGSTPILHQDSMTSSNPGLRRDSAILASPPVARQQSLSDLHHGMSYNDYRCSGVNRVFRSYLDYQAVRQSYLLAVSQESLLESETPNQSTQSLSTAGLLSLPLHVVTFLFCPPLSHFLKVAHTRKLVLIVYLCILRSMAYPTCIPVFRSGTFFKKWFGQVIPVVKLCIVTK